MLKMLASATLLLLLPLTGNPNAGSGGSGSITEQSLTIGRYGESICGTFLGKRSDGDGDAYYDYDLEGALFTIKDPAETLMDANGFLDLAKVTSSRLEKLGIPPRPTNVDELEDWIVFARGLRHRGEVLSKNPPCIQVGIHASPPLTFTNWAGYRAAGTKYYGVSSSATIPNVYISTCSQESMAQWIGVNAGGNSGSNLAQIGYVHSQYSGTLTHHPFYEFVGGPWETPGLINFNSPSIQQGQNWSTYIRYVTRYRWDFSMTNLSTQDTHAYSHGSSNGGGTNYLGPDGVFISERLWINGGSTQYMNHSTARFRSSRVRLSDGTTPRMSVENPGTITMMKNGVILGEADSLDVTNSNFSEHWRACGTFG